MFDAEKWKMDSKRKKKGNGVTEEGGLREKGLKEKK